MVPKPLVQPPTGGLPTDPTGSDDAPTESEYEDDSDDKDDDDDDDDKNILDDPVTFCHFFPEYCDVKDDVEHCNHNTTGLQCEKCIEGYFGDPTDQNQNPEDVCQPCPCPSVENK